MRTLRVFALIIANAFAIGISSILGIWFSEYRMKKREKEGKSMTASDYIQTFLLIVGGALVMYTIIFFIFSSLPLN